MDTGNDPAEFTAENIANSKRQTRLASYDWDREVNTTDPLNYYCGRANGFSPSFHEKAFGL